MTQYALNAVKGTFLRDFRNKKYPKQQSEDTNTIIKLTFLQYQVCYTPDHCDQCKYVDVDSLYFMYTSYFWNIRLMMVTNI